MYGTNIRGFAPIGNVKRFLQGFVALEERGAPEATMMVVTGIPGLGKSSTAKWYANQNKLPYVAMKPNASASWLLEDICVSLGVKPERGSKKNFNLIIEKLAKMQRGLVIDEVEHALANAGQALEQVRAIGDATELPIVLVGREYVLQKIERIPAVRSRVTSTVSFQPLDADDFTALLKHYSIPYQAGVPAALVKASDGLVRTGLNELRKLWDWSKENQDKPVTASLIKGGSDAGSR